MKVLTTKKLPDLEGERSMRKRSLTDFRNSYNKGLPSGFPSATPSSLLKFKKANPSLFNDGVEWSLDKHRKKFMDWLPQYERSISLQQEK